MIIIFRKFPTLPLKYYIICFIRVFFQSSEYDDEVIIFFAAFNDFFVRVITFYAWIFVLTNLSLNLIQSSSITKVLIVVILPSG